METMYQINYKNKPYDFNQGRKLLSDYHLTLFEHLTPSTYELFVCTPNLTKEMVMASPNLSVARASFFKFPNQIRLHSLYVQPDFRHLGIASYLTCMCLKRICNSTQSQYMPSHPVSHIPGFYTTHRFLDRFSITPTDSSIPHISKAL